MARPLAAASAAWTVAILAAIAGVLLPSDHLRISLALFAFGVALGLLVAVVLVADGLRHRGARRLAAVPESGAASPLTRLEYLPAVTTGTRRIRWQGAPYRISAAAESDSSSHPEPLTLPAAAELQKRVPARASAAERVETSRAG